MGKILKSIGIIGTVGASIVSVAGMGIMIGGGYMTYNYDTFDKPTNSTKIKMGVGPFNYTPPLSTSKYLISDFWSAFRQADQMEDILEALIKVTALQGPNSIEYKSLLRDKQVFERIQVSGSMVIGGAVLFSIFTVVAIVSGVIWLINRK